MFPLIAAGFAASAVAAASASISITPGSDIPLVNVNPSTVTVSGISSGAFMAAQMHVAFSTFFTGAGILAGGPYWCAQADVVVALSSCMTSGWEIDVDYLSTIMENTQNFGFIDSLSALRYSRVWMLSAMNDSVVDVTVVQKNAALYSKYLANPNTQLLVRYDIPGEHSQLTNNYGSPCTFLGSPYINNCNFDAAGDMLQWLYNGKLTPPNATHNGRVHCKYTSKIAAIRNAKYDECSATPPSTTFNASWQPVLRAGQGNVYSFDQGLFVGGGGFDTAAGLAETAFVYIPNVCLRNCTNCAPSTVCTLHVAFHGCLQTQDDIGTQFVTDTGYIAWADANNFVVLFPQAVSNGLNPKGCFDWWGYAGEDYASNIGTQTLAVRNMANVLVGAQLIPNRTLSTEFIAQYRQSTAGIAAARSTKVL